jgi:hypothetical protein
MQTNASNARWFRRARSGPCGSGRRGLAAAARRYRVRIAAAAIGFAAVRGSVSGTTPQILAGSAPAPSWTHSATVVKFLLYRSFEPRTSK